MTHFIDRRLNPKGKSLANRQRFLRRARTQIREAVQKSLKDAAVADIGKERKIKISTKGTQEPRFRLDPKSGGEHDFVLPGNKEYTPGDEIKKPRFLELLRSVGRHEEMTSTACLEQPKFICLLAWH